MSTVTDISNVRSIHSHPAAHAKATVLHGQPSEEYEAKVAEAHALLQGAAAHGPVTQASSLGAEDVVITHLINALGLDIPVFVLDTGALHRETLALMEQSGFEVSYSAVEECEEGGAVLRMNSVFARRRKPG